MPARAALAWDDRRAIYLLIPDLGTAHLRIYRPMLHQLHALRRAVGEPSRLVIATANRRAGAWEELLEDVARTQADVIDYLRRFVVKAEVYLKYWLNHDSRADGDVAARA